MATLAIELPTGEKALIDACDRDLVAGFSWRILRLRVGGPYVHAWHNQMHLYLHRLVIGAPDGMTVDHVNGDGLDNRRLNLRLATQSQNLANRGGNRTGKTSRYKGVSWSKTKKRWVAYIGGKNRTRSLGSFHDEDEAARAYDRAAFEAWGEFARLNFP